ncbi:hypothetical protein AALP_AA8G373400 [Arabis alpina]|uniref:Transcription repressor n=1 Tax=Arabis alpina TaxID=50452 RepID=A0A087GBW3_ARAAL|nr:hypothetical protein AALP_AA8G373400 [Arabis alpina]
MKEMNQKMGTHHKFRFSDIMPHSWLYKLKGISRSSRKHLPSSPKHISLSSDASSSRKLRLSSSSPVHQPQASSSSPLKSSFKRKIKRKTVYKPSPRLKLSSASLNSNVSLTTSSRNHRSKSSSFANATILEPSSINHCSKTSSANAISDSTIGSSSDSVSSPSDQNQYGVSRVLESQSIDIKEDHSVRKLSDVSEEPSPSENMSLVLVENVKEPSFEVRTQQKLKKPKAGSSSGIRIRANSPKIARKKTKGRTSTEPKKKGVPESFAIVLTSVDPERDFRESMVEMIVENKMKEQKDLEDLLACYLSLNSSEYHDIIIKAFEKTWFHLTHLT